MGREIRRVPADWEHPRDVYGHYIPLYDADFDEVEQKWVDDRALWLKGEHPDQVENANLIGTRFAEWGGPSPDPESYRNRSWAAEEATHYQMYETVSEGTPLSPVFASLDEMTAWLIADGYSEAAAQAFTKGGWAPSFTMVVSADHVDAYQNIEGLVSEGASDNG